MSNTADAQANLILVPDFQPRQHILPAPVSQLSVQDLNAWLKHQHGQVTERLANRGIQLGFRQDLPHHSIALRVSTDNASFSFAMPTPVPMQRYSQGEPMVQSALERIPSMERAFQAYDAMHDGQSKHQRGQVPVQNGPLEDRHGWQLQACEGTGPGNWRTSTRTTACLEDGLVSWCAEQSALRAAMSKERLVAILQDPAQAKSNPAAPTLTTANGNASAFDLPGLTTERHAYRAYLSGGEDITTGQTRLSVQVYMLDAGHPDQMGKPLMTGSTMELHASGVGYQQGLGAGVHHDYAPESFGVDASVAGFFIESRVPMVNLMPQHSTPAQDSYDYTVGLEFEEALTTDDAITR
jgi:hypothetical protein